MNPARRNRMYRSDKLQFVDCTGGPTNFSLSIALEVRQTSVCRLHWRSDKLQFVDCAGGPTDFSLSIALEVRQTSVCRLHWRHDKLKFVGRLVNDLPGALIFIELHSRVLVDWVLAFGRNDVLG